MRFFSFFISCFACLSEQVIDVLLPTLEVSFKTFKLILASLELQVMMNISVVEGRIGNLGHSEKLGSAMHLEHDIVDAAVLEFAFHSVGHVGTVGGVSRDVDHVKGLLKQTTRTVSVFCVSSCAAVTLEQSTVSAIQQSIKIDLGPPGDAEPPETESEDDEVGGGPLFSFCIEVEVEGIFDVLDACGGDGDLVLVGVEGLEEVDVLVDVGFAEFALGELLIGAHWVGAAEIADPDVLDGFAGDGRDGVSFADEGHCGFLFF